MYYELFVERADADEIVLTALERGESLKAGGSTVLVEVERSVAGVGGLARALTLKQDRAPAGWCSFWGRVVEAGNPDGGIQVGDRVGAIGPTVSHIVVPTEACSVLPDSLVPDWEASWALLVALFRAVRGLRIEIGESVLVLGGGLAGDLATQLSLVAGAGRVIGYDPGQSAGSGHSQSDRSGPAPMWITDLDSLQEHLPVDRADVLVDISADARQLGKALLWVREGGRAVSLSAEPVAPADFDFYPSVHRRSLMWRNADLRSGLRSTSDARTGYEQESEFLTQLIRRDCLDRSARSRQPVYAPDSGSERFQIGDLDRLIVQWKGHE